jgi:hypothetical protein
MAASLPPFRVRRRPRPIMRRPGGILITERIHHEYALRA